MLPNSPLIKTFKTHSIEDIKKALHSSIINQKTLVLLDVDDTLITPKANMFRYPHNIFIDELKKNKDKIPNFKEIMSQWRLHRKSILVHDEWPSIIEEAKRCQATVFALTQMDTGPFGFIPSMEEWRHQELNSKNIFFSENLDKKTNVILKQDERGYAVFYNGIIMTGPFRKVEVFSELLKSIQPNKILFVDDREDQVKSLGSLSQKIGISYTGIILRMIETLPGSPRDEIIHLQKKYLFEKNIWLEDEEAQAIYEKNSSS